MKVRVYPADASGCGHYRLIWPGRTIDVLEPDTEVIIGGRHVNGRMSRADADVVVFQRVMSRQLINAMKALQQTGIKVVVDVDDDFSALHPQHPSRRILHPKVNPDVNWRLLMEACAVADLVTVSTEALAERYGTVTRAVVLHNCIPDWLLTQENVSDGRTVGWSGFHAFHPGDLEVTHGGVAAAVASEGARFRVIGTADGIQRALSLGLEPDATGPKPFDHFHAELAHLSVGIVPLAESAFNDAKSWLKGLEFAAAGVPFAASTTTSYRMLEARGAGVTVRPRARSWRREVTRLLRERADHVEAGRAVARELTYSKNAWRWAEAWASA